MPTRSALLGTLTIALLAVPASALAAGVVVPSSVAGSTTVPAGGSTTLTLRCPATAVALNAAVTRRGAGVTVRRSIPGADSGDWRFRLTAAAGARRRGVRAVLRCVRLAVPSGVSDARLVVGTRRSPVFTIPAGGFVASEVGCHSGFVATGYGLDRGAGRDATLAAAIPTASGWNFSLENTGSTPARARFTARCLRRVVSASSGGSPTSLSFRTTRRKFSNTVGPGARRSFSHSCGRSEFSVSTGSAVDPADDIELSGSHPARSRGGSWVFARASSGDTVRSSLVCLNLRSGFG
jgi:hypothetical protein